MALYKSPYSDLQVLVRAPVVQYHPVTGVEIARTRALRANFGTHGGEFNATDPLTGEVVKHAIINGHFYDTEAAAEQNDWTPEELESVEYQLDKLARNQPYLIAKIDLTRPPLPAPWPTYTETAEGEIVQFAVSLGLVEGTLAYERENENRTKIVAALEDHLAGKPAKRGPGRPRKVESAPEPEAPDPAAEALKSISLP